MLKWVKRLTPLTGKCREGVDRGIKSQKGREGIKEGDVTQGPLAREGAGGTWIFSSHATF